MSGSSSRVSIPNNLRKTIQNLKEIVKNHSEDEIHAMLRECSMDPNETVQRLLLQDPFHEVKRKRDKRKENTREPVDTKWKPASQGRGGWGGRGNYSSHYMSHDTGGERNVGKENGIHQATNKGITASISPPSQDTESKSAIPISSSVAGLPNGPSKIEKPVPSQEFKSKDSSVRYTTSIKENPATAAVETSKPSTGDAKSSVSVHHASNSSKQLSSTEQASGSEIYASALDPVLVPPLDAHLPGSVDTIKREVGSQQTAVEATVKKVVSRDVSGSEFSSLVGKGSSEIMQGKVQGFDANQFSDTSQAASSLSRTSSSGSRPSSNYSNRSQQLNGSHKAVGPVKEWKPKSTHVKPAPVLGKLATTDAKPTTEEVARTLPVSVSMSSDDRTSEVQNKLEELRFSDTKHVIIPNHLQVPESERTGLSFGSFDANFGLTTRFADDTESLKGSAELSESSEEAVDNVEVSTSSLHMAPPSAQEADFTDHSQSAAEVLEAHTSREAEISSIIPTAPEYDQSKTEAASALDTSPYSIVHTAPTYSNFGLVPQMIGNQFATSEGAEPQTRDATRSPSFIVQQPFDPAASYYTSMYRPTVADGDGRFSPFFAPAPAPASATKYSGNIALLPAQTCQTLQDSGNPLVLSSTGPAPLVTQAAGVMQSSAAVSQQSVPIFWQPPGVHLSHYPPNYLQYNQYFSPFFIPSPSMHPFLTNAAFPQQPPTGNMYPAPGAPGAAPVKYSLSQYKPTTNSSNPNHIGMPTGYVTSGSSTGSEDLASSRYRENNVYIAGQQSEGSVWIPTPGRDISAMQATSFYNLPPSQGQHLTFPGIYHHATQTVAPGTVHPMLQQTQAMAGAVEMGTPPSGVYPQPQRTQINWVNNY